MGNDEKPGTLEVPARLAYGDRVNDSVTARILIRNPSQRTGNAVMGLLKCWGLAVISIFIPLGHFFLVPAFFIAGPVVFLMGLREQVRLEGARGTCPMCGETQPFTEHGPMSAAAQHPVRCSACRRQLVLTAELPGSVRSDAVTAEPSNVRVWMANADEPAGVPRSATND